jgi:LacI family transcriptional regulator
VARLAAVSQPVVSYVLSGDSRAPVAAETRQRVLAAIASLGYVPDHSARSLRRRRTFTLACVIPDITNPFYPAFQRGVQDAADLLGYDVLTYNTDGDPEKEARCLRSIQQGRVDGVVAVLFHQTAVALRDLLDRGIFVVRFEAARKAAGLWPIDNLYVDNAAAARAVIVHLIERGHSRIGVITGRKGPRPARLFGYLHALTEHGIELDDHLVREGDFQESGAQRAMRELLTLPVPPTAVFAVNDLMAIGAVVAIREAGLRIPEDISVAGFDDIVASRFTTPALTTVAQHPERLGRRAAEMVLERLKGMVPDHGRSEEMPYELVIRDST